MGELTAAAGRPATTSGSPGASMPHDTPLISTVAVGLGYAFVGGTVAHRLGLPPLVGYLLAGIAVGPFTPGFVADAALAPQLAEIGVILLMFGGKKIPELASGLGKGVREFKNGVSGGAEPAPQVTAPAATAEPVARTTTTETVTVAPAEPKRLIS